MASTFEKMNLKDQKQIVVLNSPESFEGELRALRDVKILRSLEGLKEIEFSLAFVTTQKDVDSIGKAVAKRVKGDAVVWFAYPKGTSKKYKSEINRDHGWQVLGECGFECVRSVAIDEDWSGARFRRVEFIKAMNRDKKYAMSAQGPSSVRTNKARATRK
jgi:hypothetical protein|nr:hypothetical protein [Candidatus Acidoferrales bacterium]